MCVDFFVTEHFHSNPDYMSEEFCLFSVWHIWIWHWELCRPQVIVMSRTFFLLLITERCFLLSHTTVCLFPRWKCCSYLFTLQYKFIVLYYRSNVSKFIIHQTVLFQCRVQYLTVFKRKKPCRVNSTSFQKKNFWKQTEVKVKCQNPMRRQCSGGAYSDLFTRRQLTRILKRRAIASVLSPTHDNIWMNTNHLFQFVQSKMYNSKKKPGNIVQKLWI